MSTITWLHANTWIEISWSSAGRRMVTPSTLSYCDKMIQNTSKYPPLNKIVILQLHLPRYGGGRKSSRLAIQSQVGPHVSSRVRWRRDDDRRLQHHCLYNLAISGNLWQFKTFSPLCRAPSSPWSALAAWGKVLCERFPRWANKATHKSNRRSRRPGKFRIVVGAFHSANRTRWAESLSRVGQCVCVRLCHHFKDDNYFWNNQNHLLVLSADTCGLPSLWEVSALQIVSTGAVPLRTKSWKILLSQKDWESQFS